MVLDVFYVSSSFHSVSSCTLWFAKYLAVDHLPFPEELDGVVDIWIIGKAQNVVVGHARLLLGGEVLGEIRDGIAGDLHGGGGPGIARRKLGEHAGGVVHEVGIKAGGLDLLFR